VFDPPLDAWFVWLGCSTVAAAALAAALALPTAPPPAADAAADTVDGVAATSMPARAHHPLAADAVRVTPSTLALRDDGRVARAPFDFGPVTPVPEDGPLATVLAGAPPESAFGDPGALLAAAAEARDRPADWESAGKLRVRTVTWGETRVTLVGA
jgi:hypothetical protein